MNEDVFLKGFNTLDLAPKSALKYVLIQNETLAS